MNKTLITFFTVLFCLTSSVGWSLELKDLVRQDGLYYKFFSDVPFTGEVTGKETGSFKNGKRDGSWIYYWDTGPIYWKGDFKNGLRHGHWIYNHPNGKLEMKGDNKNGLRHGPWVIYYSNGKLVAKGNYKNDKKDGYWVWYEKDGSLNNDHTGIFKDGKNISKQNIYEPTEEDGVAPIHEQTLRGAIKFYWNKTTYYVKPIEIEYNENKYNGKGWLFYKDEGFTNPEEWDVDPYTTKRLNAELNRRR